MAGWMAADHDTIPFQRGTAEAIGGMTTGATETGAIATGTTDGARLAIPSDDGTVGRIIAGVIPLTGGPLAGTGKTNRRLRRLSVRYASACRWRLGRLKPIVKRQAEAYRTPICVIYG